MQQQSYLDLSTNASTLKGRGAIGASTNNAVITNTIIKAKVSGELKSLLRFKSDIYETGKEEQIEREKQKDIRRKNANEMRNTVKIFNSEKVRFEIQNAGERTRRGNLTFESKRERQMPFQMVSKPKNQMPFKMVRKKKKNKFHCKMVMSLPSCPL